MFWFFGLTASYLPRLEGHARVAVHTRPRDAIPICLWDGPECSWTDWLRSQSVQVVFHRCEFAYKLAQVFDGSSLSIALGCFLRLDVPLIAKQLGVTESYVLYTDTDVVFTGKELVALHSLRPRYLAAAPEYKPTDWSYFNSGVLWFNLEGMERTRELVYSAIQTMGLERPFDDPVLNKVYEGKWDRLPAEYNWKAYWPMNPEARIIHFHGPKATQNWAEVDPALHHLLNCHFEAQVMEFDRLLAETV